MSKIERQFLDSIRSQKTWIVKLETFKEMCDLDVKLLIKERQDIRRSVDTELHNLIEVKTKMELTIDDFIEETVNLKSK